MSSSAATKTPSFLPELVGIVVVVVVVDHCCSVGRPPMMMRRPIGGHRDGPAPRRTTTTPVVVGRRRRRDGLGGQRQAVLRGEERLGVAQPLLHARLDAQPRRVGVLADFRRKHVGDARIQPAHRARVNVLLPVAPVRVAVVRQEHVARVDRPNRADVDGPRARLVGVGERLDVLDVLPLLQPLRVAIVGPARVVDEGHGAAVEHGPELGAERAVVAIRERVVGVGAVEQRRKRIRVARPLGAVDRPQGREEVALLGQRRDDDAGVRRGFAGFDDARRDALELAPQRGLAVGADAAHATSISREARPRVDEGAFVLVGRDSLRDALGEVVGRGPQCLNARRGVLDAVEFEQRRGGVGRIAPERARIPLRSFVPRLLGRLRGRRRRRL
mmetsp:Transcript_5783/g.24126  ORF Transcript_5783/g.24126 Transcript_5783/m.24126 type:complete len:387 (+) Transcript_5783:276-1436(+)